MDNRQYAFSWLVQKGYSPQAAAGIVGNLVQESGVNPTVRPGDSGTAHGIAQWRGDRYAALMDYAKQHGGSNDLGTQLGFLDTELRGKYGSTFQKLMAAKDPREAAAAFALGYERPAGAQTGVAENVDGWKNRLNAAYQVSGMKPGEIPAQISSPAMPTEATPQTPAANPLSQVMAMQSNRRSGGLLTPQQDQSTDDQAFVQNAQAFHAANRDNFIRGLLSQG